MQVVNVKVAHIRPKYNNLKEWMEDENNEYVGRGGVVFVNGERFPKEGLNGQTLIVSKPSTVQIPSQSMKNI